MPPPPRPIDFNRLAIEARAKVFWGDSREEVIAFLVVQGMPRPEAEPLVDRVVTERARSIRAIGIRKTFTGIGLMLIPIVAGITFLIMGEIPVKFFAVTILLGLYGVYLLINGIIMLVAPRFEPGDVADK